MVIAHPREGRTDTHHVKKDAKLVLHHTIMACYLKKNTMIGVLSRDLAGKKPRAPISLQYTINISLVAIRCTHKVTREKPPRFRIFDFFVPKPRSDPVGATTSIHCTLPMRP